MSGYAFVPFIRRGITTAINQAPTGSRAEIEIALSTNAGAAQVTLPLVGPEDVTALDPRSVIRVWPRAGVYDAASNYLPLLEFDQPDLPWRYSPAAADSKDRLLPWLCLIALKDSEFKRTDPDAEHKLPIIEVMPNTPLPNLAQAWAWAHVQVTGTMSPLAADLAGLLVNHPSRVLARLLCPRRLEKRTRYTVFLVPTFERGRAAGVGEPVPNSVSALQAAWTSAPSLPRKLPVYYQWEFVSGDEDDFEALVRKLGKVALTEGGARDMDVIDPGLGLWSVARTLGLEGALQLPRSTGTAWPSSQRDAWIDALRERVDAGTTLLTVAGAGRRLGPPLYGRWHAGRAELGTAKTPWYWFDELNADPRLRVVAAMGARIVQSQQEPLLESAWRQVEGIRRLNSELRLAQAAREIARRVHARHLADADPEAVIQLTGPVHTRVRRSETDAVTLPFTLALTRVRPGLLAPQWRRITRRLGPVSRRLGRSRRPHLSTILQRLDRGELAVAPAPPTPTGIANLANVPFATYDPAQAPPRPSFAAAAQYPQTGEAWVAAAPSGSEQGSDSKAAQAFRSAIADAWATLTQPDPQPVPLAKADISQIAQRLVRELDPETTITQLYKARADVDKEILKWSPKDELEPVMAAPTFPTPMYVPLRDLSQDWLFPGLEKIPPNSMSLLEENTRFMRAYMVGLNHEMARELLWNGYPTDQRGTYFRQFWDPSSYYVPAGQTAQGVEDIDPIVDWPKPGHTRSALEDAGRSGSRSGRLILLLRGDLLARYPNLLVYASKAKLRTGVANTEQNWADPKKREPHPTVEKQPLFGGALKPDVSFFAFDLTSAEATGNTNAPGGWYFILQEQPSESRFNLNSVKGTSIETWEDLAWDDLTAAGALGYIDIQTNVPLQGRTPLTPGSATWPTIAGTGSSADLGSILLQRRVRLAVHASDMIVSRRERLSFLADPNARPIVRPIVRPIP